MKVKFMVSEHRTYGGTLNISEEELERLQNMKVKDLGKLLMYRVDVYDYQDKSIYNATVEKE